MDDRDGHDVGDADTADDQGQSTHHLGQVVEVLVDLGLGIEQVGRHARVRTVRTAEADDRRYLFRHILGVGRRPDVEACGVGFLDVPVRDGIGEGDEDRRVHRRFEQHVAEYPDHAVRDAVQLDAPRLVGYVAVLVGQVLADHSDPGAAGLVVVVEEPTTHDWHLERLRQFQGRGDDGHGEGPVVVGGLGERECHDVGELQGCRHRHHVGEPRHPRRRLLGDTRIGAEASELVLCVGDDQVSAELAQLRLQVSLGTLVDADRRDDGRHAEDRAEHDQERPDLAGRQPGQRHTDEFPKTPHDTDPCHSSPTISPSRMEIRRSVAPATSRSWLTRQIALSSDRRPAKISMTLAAF